MATRTVKTGQVLAMKMLEKSKSIKERADSYFTSVKRNIQRDVLDSLTQKKEALDDKLFELQNFTLETNLNSGLRMMTKEDAENNFKAIIETEYQLTMIEMELKVKQASFDKYFEV